MRVNVKIKKFNQGVKIPAYAHPGDAGCDLYSQGNYSLKPGEIHTFFLGFALEFPKNFVAIIKDKGGLANIDHLHTLGGVFDSGYRGEYNVCLANLGTKKYNIKKGQKLAQLVILPMAVANFKKSLRLSDSRRGQGRFGSTGG